MYLMKNLLTGFGFDFSSDIVQPFLFETSHTHCLQRWSKQTLPYIKRLKSSVFCLILDFHSGKRNVIVICSCSSLHTPTQTGAGNLTPPSGAQLQAVIRLLNPSFSQSHYPP